MISLIFAAAILAHTVQWQVFEGMRLPDPWETPGVTVLITQRALCATKWGKDARHVTEGMKEKACAAYGARSCPGPSWELDHLISRELGGADDLKNLWPQPIKQARLKDRLENALHKEVCGGKLSLKEAQKNIASNWYVLYKKMFKEGK